MYVLNSLRLKNTLPHRDSRIDFTDGIHVIRARNGQGKSTPFQLMTRLISGEMPYAASKKQKENRGAAHLSFSRGEVYYEVSLDFATNKYAIIENGRALEFKQPAALAKMDQILPFSLPLLQNMVYISSDSFPFLLRGTPQQRKLLFEHLFDIDTDAQYKMFQHMSRDMQKLQAQREALSAIQCERVNPKLLLNQRKRIAKLETRLRVMQKQAKTTAAYAKAQRAWRQFEPDYPHLSKQSDAQLESRLAALDPEQLQQELESAKVYATYEQDKREHAEMSRKVADLTCKLALDKTKLPKLTDGHGQLADLIDAHAAHLKQHAAAPKGDIDDLHERAQAAEDEREKVLRKLKALAHAKECPLCQSKLSGASAKHVLKDLQAEAKRLQTESLRLQDLAELVGKTSKLLRFLSSHGVAWAAARQLVGHTDALRLRQDLLDAQDALAEIKPPPAPKAKPRAAAAIQQDLHHCLDERDAINALLDLRETPRQLNEASEADVDNLRERISVLREQLSEDTVKSRKYNEVQRDIIRLKRKLYGKPVVEALKHLYGPKGLRLSRVRTALDAYIVNLNKLAPLVFKDYIFSAEMSDTGIDIICKRPAGVSDVRRFSSAEGMLLPVLSLMALYPVLPASRRTNLLILDEGEAHMDTTNRKKYVALLPELQKMFPSLWCITPLTKAEFPITGPGVREYTVEMDSQGVSSLITL